MECYICGSKQILQDGDISAETFSVETVSLCTSCGLVFLDNRVVDEEYYKEGDFDKEIRKNVKQSLIRSTKMAWSRIPFVAPFLSNADSYLEIGSGTGAMIDVVTNFIPYTNVWGIEPSPEAASVSIDRGHQVATSEFDKDMFTRKFDIIGLFHVIEHVEDPKQLIMDISDLLSDEGHLILEYPDLEKALDRDFFNASTYFQKSHIYDFSFCHILYMAFRGGLTPISVVEHSKDEYPSDKNVLVIFKKGISPIETITWSDGKNTHGNAMREKLNSKGFFQ